MQTTRKISAPFPRNISLRLWTGCDCCVVDYRVTADIFAPNEVLAKFGLKTWAGFGSVSIEKLWFEKEVPQITTPEIAISAKTKIYEGVYYKSPLSSPEVAFL